MGIGNLHTVVHEEDTAERLALEGERLQVDAVQLVDTVLALRVEASHLDARQVLVLELLVLPPVEDGLVLATNGFRYKDKSGSIISMINGNILLSNADGSGKLEIKKDGLYINGNKQ